MTLSMFLKPFQREICRCGHSAAASRHFPFTWGELTSTSHPRRVGRSERPDQSPRGKRFSELLFASEMWHTREPDRRESSVLLSRGGHSVPDVESGLVASREAPKYGGGHNRKTWTGNLDFIPGGLGRHLLMLSRGVWDLYVRRKSLRRPCWQWIRESKCGSWWVGSWRGTLVAWALAVAEEREVNRFKR